MKRRSFLQAAGIGLAAARTGWSLGGRSVDVAVVGAGAIGATTAWLLRAEGLSVALLDKGAAGREASWASAGMVQPYGSSKSESWSTRSALLSRKLYDDFEPRLFEETGRRIGYGGEGGLVLAFDDEEAEGLKRYAGRGEEDHPTRFLDRADLRQRDPGLPEGVVGALLYSGHRYLDARTYTGGVLEAARKKGVDVKENAPAVAMLWDGDRVVGVKTKTEDVPAKTTIVAAGAWSGTVDLKLPMPLRPVHGQILAVEGPKGGLKHNLQRLGAGGYATPRADGRVVVGATSEDFGFEKRVTDDGRAALAAMVKALLPHLEAKVLDTWSGLRPGSADGSPAVGPDPRVSSGFFWAAGHGGYGMMQGPATASVLVDLVLGRKPRIPIDGVRPARFVR